MSDLLIVENPPAIVAEKSATANFLEVIGQAARDPNVDVQKMHGLLDVQERMMAKQAEIDFNIDFTKLQAELPRITKDKSIIHKGTLISKYATYEKIDEVVRPLLIKHGFGLRFNSEPQPDGKTVVITGTLSHKGGHSITDKIPLGFDTSGAKNNVQAVGSTIAYGKRYLSGMLLNLVFEGEDDDGVRSSYKPITDDMAATLKDLIRETNTDTQRFLTAMNAGCKTVDEISFSDYDRMHAALTTKKSKMTQGGGLL